MAPQQPYYVMVPVRAIGPTPLTESAIHAAMQGADAPLPAAAPSPDIDWEYLAVLEGGVSPLQQVLGGGDPGAFEALLQRPDGTHGMFDAWTALGLRNNCRMVACIGDA